MALSFIDWERKDVLVLSLIGRLTLGEGTQLLRRLIGDSLALNKKNIVLKLAEVVYIDSSGLGELLAAHRSVAKHGGKLKLVKLTSRAQKLFHMSRLYTIFEIYEDEDSAVDSFESAVA